eukprot:GFUD01030671.1.p2 GENE.GFUD01030671.1~~GFUD01030671.1.p2  ORF type:complete len:152 (+),score=22.84 GFUD01030671.1:753-1208(+)
MIISSLNVMGSLRILTHKRKCVWLGVLQLINASTSQQTMEGQRHVMENVLKTQVTMKNFGCVVKQTTVLDMTNLVEMSAETNIDIFAPRAMNAKVKVFLAMVNVQKEKDTVQDTRSMTLLEMEEVAALIMMILVVKIVLSGYNSAWLITVV